MPARLDSDLPQALRRLAHALEVEHEPSRFRRQLAHRLETAVRPAERAVITRVMAIPSRGGPRRGMSIRRAIALAVRTDVRLDPRTTGVRIAIGRRTMPRQFHNAPKRFNQQAFRRSVYGRGVVIQRGEPYFEKTLQAGRPRYRAACAQVIQDTAARTARRVR